MELPPITDAMIANLTGENYSRTGGCGGVVNALIENLTGYLPVDKVNKGYNGIIDKVVENYESYIKIKIISRTEWGALPPKNGVDYPDVQSNDLNAYYHSIVIHHTGNANNTITPIELQRKEMDNGYADIPYHFLIDTKGNIYEGRPITKEQAHVKGVHHGLIGVALLADLDTQNDGLSWWKKPVELFSGDRDLTDPMLYSLLNLSRYLKIKYGINDLGGHKEYHVVLNPSMVDGGDGRVCPGNLGMLAVNFLRRVLNLPLPR